jgi:hypothetical protein
MRVITRQDAREQGLTRYFTGKPCKRGHLSERMTSNGSCWECVWLWQQMPNNKARKSKKQKKWRRDNPDKVEEMRKRTKRWKNTHWLEYKAKQKAWRLRNRDKLLARSKEWNRLMREGKVKPKYPGRHKRVSRRREA